MREQQPYVRGPYRKRRAKSKRWRVAAMSGGLTRGCAESGEFLRLWEAVAPGFRRTLSPLYLSILVKAIRAFARSERARWEASMKQALLAQRDELSVLLERERRIAIEVDRTGNAPAQMEAAHEAR